MEAGYVSTMEQAFKNIWSMAEILSAKENTVPPAEAIRLILDAGKSFPALAHPFIQAGLGKNNRQDDCRS